MGLFIPRAVSDELKGWSAKCYPFEGCGLLVGQPVSEGKKVVRFVPIPNLLRTSGQGGDSEAVKTATETLGQERLGRGGAFEFVMDPAAFNRASVECGKEGLDVLGILHTHPDHPARPSKTDAAQPCLSGWSIVIVKVDEGRFVEMRSWVRDEEDQPFAEERVVIEN